ncbi:MMPL family transporter [Berryella wangjianweii]|uniref:MMPL family transporter n=1 Tax=Berryella wangjianweii TaxID=2734634 RepID=A0A6M8IW63_9ACTN|nr:MMPL family transporter [Berryella wangjianweii]QKF06895.1 MMPL family transporter [Berryella wangjianweii]
MEKLSRFLTAHAGLILALYLGLAIASALAIPLAHVNRDLSAYLPSSLQSTEALQLMRQQFGSETSATVMVKGASDEQLADVAAALERVDGVGSVRFDASDSLMRADDYARMTLSLRAGTYDERAAAILDDLRQALRDQGFDPNAGEGQNAFVGGPAVQANDDNLSITLAIACVLLTLILFVMARSWIEPFMFLGTIGVAIVLGMGTNALLPDVSKLTFSIAAILQLVLSMDYSIMLTDAYREQRARTDSPHDAMARALSRTATAIASSSATTVAGLLCMVAMSFAIGPDLGIVLAKGVLFSLLVVFTLLPACIVLLDRALLRTAKPAPRPQMSAYARMQHRGRAALAVGMVVLVAAGFGLKSTLEGSFYTAPATADDKAIDERFPALTNLAALYPRGQEDAAARALERIEALDGVVWAEGLANTLDRKRDVAELSQATGLDEAVIARIAFASAHPDQAAALAAAATGSETAGPNGSADGREDGRADRSAPAATPTAPPASTNQATPTAPPFPAEPVSMSLTELVEAAAALAAPDSPLVASASDEDRARLNAARKRLDEARDAMQGAQWSRLALTLDAGPESATSRTLVADVRRILADEFEGEARLAGDAALTSEAPAVFSKDLTLVTLLTIGCIFAIVLATFRSIPLALALVALIQGSINLTCGLTSAFGVSTYYVALVIVQAILMGATIDYAILYTQNYRLARAHLDVRASIQRALAQSVGTIATSGGILLTATLTLGLVSSDPTTAQVCLTLARGTAVAVASIVLLLPGTLATLDRFARPKSLAAGKNEQSAGGDA